VVLKHDHTCIANEQRQCCQDAAIVSRDFVLLLLFHAAVVARVMAQQVPVSLLLRDGIACDLDGIAILLDELRVLGVCFVIRHDEDKIMGGCYSSFFFDTQQNNFETTFDFGVPVLFRVGSL
jgi:hypothetical protein